MRFFSLSLSSRDFAWVEWAKKPSDCSVVCLSSGEICRLAPEQRSSSFLLLLAAAGLVLWKKTIGKSSDEPKPAWKLHCRCTEQSWQRLAKDPGEAWVNCSLGLGRKLGVAFTSLPNWKAAAGASITWKKYCWGATCNTAGLSCCRQLLTSEPLSSAVASHPLQLVVFPGLITRAKRLQMSGRRLQRCPWDVYLCVAKSCLTGDFCFSVVWLKWWSHFERSSEPAFLKKQNV